MLLALGVEQREVADESVLASEEPELDGSSLPEVHHHRRKPRTWPRDGIFDWLPRFFNARVTP